MVRRYAEGTTVTVQSSRGEITGILAKHGVLRQGWTSEPEADTLQFELASRVYRLTIPQPTSQSLYEQWQADGDRTANQLKYLPNDNQVAAEWRRRWRATVLLLKAKLEFADGTTSTLENELLPYLVLKNGNTVGEAIRSGAFPLLGDGK